METYEEWRLILDVGKRKGVDDAIAAALEETPGDVDVHRRGDQVLIYALTEEAVRFAGELMFRLLGERGVSATPTLSRWNPGGERWQHPSLPIQAPERDIGLKWVELGELGWEVRLGLQSGREARSLAQELLDAGRPTITGLRNRVTVGVADEAEAGSLADELRLRAPTARFAIRPLSRYRRWLIRQRVLGNYAAGG